MKPSPKKSSSSKVKQRTKSSSSGNSSNNNNNPNSNQQNSGSTISIAGQPSAHNTNQSQQQLHPPQKQTIPQSDSSGNDASNMCSSKDKSSYKSYAGLSPRSVRTAWEQHDKQETEVAPDVYAKLSEDATYKLWELANNIKTYSRHSSGRVTFDLVNEVLKDSDVPPIVGANSQPWDKIEYDGAYFFNSDEVLDLREEYIKHISLEQHNVPVLTTTWMAEADIAEDLIAMHNNICDAIFIGDEACFNTAIDILQYNRHTPSLMKLLLTKAIEMLGFEYTEETLRRALEYLEALTQNCHVAHSDLTLELSLLSQLFVNLLVGPVGFVHAKLLQPNGLVQRPLTSLVGATSQPQAQQQHQQPQQQQQEVLDNISPLFNNPMALLESNLPPVEDSNNSNSNATEELLRSIENIKDGADGIDLNIKDEYEALFSMVQGLGKQESVDEAMVGAEPMADGVVDGFQVKTEFDPEAFDANASNFIVQQASGSVVAPGGHVAHHPGTLHDTGMLTNEMLNSLAASAAAAVASGATVTNDVNMFELKPDPTKTKLDTGTPPAIIDADPEENVSLPMSESSDGGGEVNNPNSTTLESENITTLICEDYLVDGVCRVIGLCASKWGFVEQECTFLLVERLQRYFQERKTPAVDYNWLLRIFRGLWAIGEFALRELLPYFYHIDSQTVPEYLVPHLNTAGIFMNGRSDIFFYEYLYDICGDSLGPFMFSYDQYIEKQCLKYHRKRLKVITVKSCYKVAAKVVPKHLPSYTPRPAKVKPTMREAFEERSDKRLPSLPSRNVAPKALFGFRFSGCRPIPLKTAQTRQRAANSIITNSTFQASTGTVEGVLKQNTSLLSSFNSKIVVARRRLLSPVTNEPPKRHVYCYGSCTI
uniref:Uncharacterized protein n=1 Tax=Anopheles epiroticus TaxID=199890 RepID=A0A182PCN8_9DIPT